jgi:Zn-dependent alcohol dehydrogenase
MGCGYQTGKNCNSLSALEYDHALTILIGAGTVLNILKPKPDDSIVIFGLGIVGLTALMAAKYLGMKQTIAVDIFDHKLPLAEELGATDVITSRNVDDIVK